MLRAQYDALYKIVNMLAYKPQAVIFDMDGLIIDTEVVARTAWQKAAAELGYLMDDDLYSRFVGRRTRDCRAMLIEAYGGAFPLSDFLVRSERLCQELLDRHGIPIKPGLYELLELLDSQGVAMGVATGSNRADAFLSLGALASRFKQIVAGDEVVRGKPAPDIYLLAATRLQLAPRQCLVLEDAALGVQAAHAAGIPVIMVPDLIRPSPSTVDMADAVCLSLHEVKYLLAKM